METKILKSFVDEMNVEYSLYISPTGKPIVRVRDLDVGETIQIKIYPSLPAAEKAFKEIEIFHQKEGV